MARVNVPVTDINRSGVAPATPVTGDPVNFHSVANDGRVVLLATNTNGASTARTLTVHISAKIDGQTVTPRTYSIPAGESRYLGPYGVSDYGRSLSVDVDHAELELSAYRMP